MGNWRDLVDPTIKDYLEALIKDTTTNREAYVAAKNKSDAQIWIAVANLSKQIFNLNLRIKYMEKLMKDLLKEQAEKPLEKPKVVIEKTKKKVKRSLVKKPSTKKSKKKKVTKRRKKK